MLSIIVDRHKLLPYVILKRKTFRKEKILRVCNCSHPREKWMEEKLVLDWTDTVWNRRPGALLKKKNLLILDSFKTHLLDQV